MAPPTEDELDRRVDRFCEGVERLCVGLRQRDTSFKIDIVRWLQSQVTAGPGLASRPFEPKHVRKKRKVQHEDATETKAESEDRVYSSDSDIAEHSLSGQKQKVKFKPIDHDELVDFLNGLAGKVNDKRTPPPLPTIKNLRQTPYKHQLHAAAVLNHARTSIFKGHILADEPGLGKTLTVMMAAVSAKQPGDGPIIVVAPPSCVIQWICEIEKGFTGLRTYVSDNNRHLTPAQLFRFDVVVTSYAYLRSELQRKIAYLRAIEAMEKDYENVTKCPVRPNLVLLSSFYNSPSAKPISRSLILDEADTGKNPYGLTFSAIQSLRSHCTACFMLTGTPMNNTWADVFCLLRLLRAHPIRHPAHMLSAFTSYDSIEDKEHKRKMRTRIAPEASGMDRLVRLLDATTLRRPKDIVHKALPPIDDVAVGFNLSAADCKASEEEYASFERAIAVSKSSESNLGRQGRGAGFAHLHAAQQHALHPMLKEMMVDLRSNDDGEEQLQTPERVNKRDAWLAKLSVDRNWYSRRIDVITRLIKKSLRDPEGSARGIVVLDEYTSFLDIVEIDIREMLPEVPVFRYDGRTEAGERCVTLEKFNDVVGPRILLTTRATGGVGLNLQHATVLILCQPIWNMTWRTQAVGRIHRAGQQHPTFVYEIFADNCEVEHKKWRTRERKFRVTKAIMDAITHPDEETTLEMSTVI